MRWQGDIDQQRHHPLIREGQTWWYWCTGGRRDDGGERVDHRAVDQGRGRDGYHVLQRVSGGNVVHVYGCIALATPSILVRNSQTESVLYPHDERGSWDIDARR